MSRKRRIYEGKAKVLYEGPEPGTLVQYFKDDASAFNNQKKGTIVGKGVLNNRISEYLMTRLGEAGIPTHFVRRLNMREQLVREVEIIPLEIVIRNIAAGSLATRFGLAEGTVLPRSIVEYYYKSDQLGDLGLEGISRLRLVGAAGAGRDPLPVASDQRFPLRPLPGGRPEACRLQARVRPALGRRGHAHRARR
jgi:phosphoribosylaminoimidazole-succinocarboxamide synthase